ncbi:ParA family protein [Botrimarina mediterranea]|uniref:MinD/ParA/CobQ/CobA-like protein n=1 Tax=Botrimarina mediterranea TaxID=2528022 RepID=A0A518K9Q8_9BACT|nr:ParA family protein [Botrimarina mediterranea]QDV74521.1 MinD/ParA/CobQ/CobA-like protein [Botrimarina mediterranea]QDV79161.1 MinD/ParA/CobQ/CobA-like protein [Planctomycetes bacterium K2D]
MSSKHQPASGQPFVIGFCNGKGGPGKTTLALNSTVELFDQGRHVALIDGEEGGINAGALNRFEPRIETRRARTAFEIDDAIQELGQSHDIILFDAPGQTSGEEVATICSVADLVVVPIKLSLKDVRGSNSVLRMVRRLQQRQNGKPESVIVFNEVRPLGEGRQSRSAANYRRQLIDAGYQVARSEIRYYEWHRLCEFVTRNPMANLQRSSDKCAMDFGAFVYEVILQRLPTTERVANG